ncbi:MAG TPA: radical SAM family heme chaperone HemW [Bacteroidales bacterium]|nr:radical SAM family heme chaperone HemW [Bacteroidales bacterium]
MAGIYLHIPFCTKKCAYCDFFSLANSKLKDDFVKAIIKEILLQKHYLQNESVQTIYFGGGTPSLLSFEQLEKILNALYKNFNVDKNIELTLEANPENLNNTFLKDLKKLSFNRLSIGIQSFNDDDLTLMRRTHNTKKAIQSVYDAKNKGFENISVDLIYGLPNLTQKKWEHNLEKMLELDVQHISAYHLTIEPKTLFKKWSDENKIQLPDEEKSFEQYRLLVEKTSANGFLHYEISNFAKDGFISLHNTNYWMGVRYLGLGPSAHSYNLTSRQWNISNLHVYLDRILKGKVPFEKENLTQKEKYNDFIITSFRTMWGLNLKKLDLNFEYSYKKYFLKKVKKYLDENFCTQNNDQIKLSEKGVFISDHIMADLLYE